MDFRCLKKLIFGASSKSPESDTPHSSSNSGDVFGGQNVYGLASDNAGRFSPWQLLGTWQTVEFLSTPPTVGSVTPSLGTGTTQAFTFHYSSVNGFSYLYTVYALWNSSLTAAGGCFVDYVPWANALYLYNDAGSGTTGPLTPGTNGTLQNSQAR
jgi:hypothetical protein